VSEQNIDLNTAEQQKHNILIKSIQVLTGPWNKRNLMEWMFVIGSILILKGCVIDQYLIPTGSMEPTLIGGNLITGDRVLVNKWIYGIRIPFTTIRLYTWSHPKRWDIVVFKTIEKNAKHKTLIKRVVGLPGETVKINHGKIEINGKQIQPPKTMPQNIYYINDIDLVIQYETNPDPKVKKIIEEMRENYPLRYGCSDEKTYSTIPDKHYFLLGDNSINSVDSRMYGWVPENHIIGRAFAIWWPIQRWRDFTGFSKSWWGIVFLYGTQIVIVLIIIRYMYHYRKRTINTQK